jgi:hypothetical protein
MTRRLSFGPSGGGLPFQEWVHNAISRIEKWSHDVITRHDYNFLRLATPAAPLTIATGAITITRSYHIVDTENGDASDDLATINGGLDGLRLVLRAADNDNTVVVKDGTGNIITASDCSLTHTQDTIELIYDATLAQWLELSRSDNTA